MNDYQKKTSGAKPFFIPVFMLFIFIFMQTTRGVCQDNGNNPRDIRLVVMVVIDQLRADMVSRMENRFGQGGFRYLLENGTWYKNARYEYATTLTAVGHASLFTGTTPSNHGIIGNYWYDQKTGNEISSVEFIPNPQDPVKKIKGPYNLLSTTIGDELVLSNNRQSRVFSVSIKDRGAILPSGFLGKAFWYDAKTGKFTASDYYKCDQQWLNSLNEPPLIDSYQNKPWELLKDKSTYIYGLRYEEDKEAITKKLPEYASRSSFPHSYNPQMLPYIKPMEMIFSNWIPYTPFGDEITVDFACRILKKENLGRNSFPDMLTVSLSVTDAIGHIYGPDSLEYEDNVLRVDRSLAKLFQVIKDSVGLEHTLIVVTADHGADYVPEMREFVEITGGRMVPKKFTDAIDAALQKKYKTNSSFILGFRNPSIFLNMKTIETLNLDIEEVERIAADVLNNEKGVAIAVTRSDLMKGIIPNIPLMENIKNVFHPKRSGNILFIQEPFWYLYHDIKDVAMHGSPYNYDTHVPLFFVGPGIKTRSVYRHVNPLDIAVTVALKLGIEAPPAASKNTLTEIFE